MNERQPSPIHTGLSGDDAAIARSIGDRAENLFRTRQLWCAGAVLVALNQGLGGDLTEKQAVRLMSGLGRGMGGSGCLCGGLSAASVGLGCFLGDGRRAPRGDRRALDAVAELHRRFLADFGSACCRALNHRIAAGSRAGFAACAGRTGRAAQLAAAIILDHRPELARQANPKALARRDSRLGSWLKIGASFIRLPSLRMPARAAAVQPVAFGSHPGDTRPSSERAKPCSPAAAVALDGPCRDPDCCQRTGDGEGVCADCDTQAQDAPSHSQRTPG